MSQPAGQSYTAIEAPAVHLGCGPPRSKAAARATYRLARL
jgi:hypothetical protein